VTVAKNPNRVAKAFIAAGAQAGRLVLREFTAGVLLIMQEVKSPLIADPHTKGKRELTDMDIMRLVFILANPTTRSYALLRGGLAAFDAAVVEFADGVQIADLPAIGEKILELYARAMSTAPSAEAGADGKKPATPSPASPPAATGSAGS